MPRRLLIALMVAAAALAAAAVAEAARTKTTLTYKAEDSDAGRHRISGFLSSARKECYADRKVIVFRTPAKGGRNPDKDKGVASDRASALSGEKSSQYSVVFRGKGTFYVGVKSTRRCGSAKGSGVVFYR